MTTSATLLSSPESIKSVTKYAAAVKRAMVYSAIEKTKNFIFRLVVLANNSGTQCTGFIESGAIIPEIQVRADSYDPRVLMAPAAKLLAAPVQESETPETPTPKRPPRKRRKTKKKPSAGEDESIDLSDE